MRLHRLAVGGACLGALTWAAVARPHATRWGATADETHRSLPGDELVERPTFTATRAITIACSRDRVWPWLAQLGQGRGGFYSYTALENLVGCRMSNAERIHDEWQSLEPGDAIRMHPRAPPLTVLDVRPGELLLLGEPGVFTWALALDPVSTEATRLVVRSRGSFGLPRALGWLLEPAHFLMEREMLLGIRRRAESSTSGRTPRID